MFVSFSEKSINKIGILRELYPKDFKELDRQVVTRYPWRAYSRKVTERERMKKVSAAHPDGLTAQGFKRQGVYYRIPYSTVVTKRIFFSRH